MHTEVQGRLDLGLDHTISAGSSSGAPYIREEEEEEERT